LREGKNFFIYGHFYEEFERYVKKEFCKWQLSPKGPLLGNLEGVRSLGNFLEKENAYLGSFYLDPDGVKSLALEAVCNFSKEQG
jgi:hypothetical protein